MPQVDAAPSFVAALRFLALTPCHSLIIDRCGSPFLALVCAGLCFANASAQRAQAPAGQPAVTFKTEINYVDVDVIVTDQHGNFVKDLTTDAFIDTTRLLC